MALGPCTIQPISRDTYMIIRLRGVVASTRSKYQEIQIVDTVDFGRALVIDNLIQSTEVDEFVYHECLVHPAMILHPNPKRVLILGGGEGATLREVLKHNVERVVMVDIDEEVVKMSKLYLNFMSERAFDDRRAEVVIMDGKEYLMRSSEVFDVIISDLTDPYASEIARDLYTEQFIRRVRERLSADGIFVTQAGSAFFYEDVYDSILNSVKRVFQIVSEYNVWIPSFGYACNFIIGSNVYDLRALTADEVKRRIEERKLRLRFYNERVHVMLLYTPIYRRSMFIRSS